MGRYSSVQAYADSNANMRTVSYDQATGATSGTGGNNNKGVVKPEKVNNPYSSTAGAGSGEFHIYRHARAREMERWKQLNEQEREQLLEQEYQAKLRHDRMEEERKTEQRRKKRQRQKEAKQRKKNLKLAGVVSNINDKNEGEQQEEEFAYEPYEPSIRDDKEKSTEGDDAKQENHQKQSSDSKPLAVPFANDGSFLEQMKRKLAEEEAQRISTGKAGEGDHGEDSDDEEGPQPQKLDDAPRQKDDEEDSDDEGPRPKKRAL